MKINIDVDSKYSDIGVDIHVPSLTPEVEKIISLMRMMDMQIAVKKGEETVLLDAFEILYIEAVERNTFIYTEKKPTNPHLSFMNSSSSFRRRIL